MINKLRVSAAPKQTTSTVTGTAATVASSKANPNPSSGIIHTSSSSSMMKSTQDATQSTRPSATISDSRGSTSSVRNDVTKVSAKKVSTSSGGFLRQMEDSF